MEKGALDMNWKDAGAAYLPLLHATETHYGIPADLLARMAYQESRWRNDIITGAKVSPAGAVGIMQMLPQYFPDVDLTNPAQSIEAGGAYLKGLYNRFGTWELAVAAYNAGPGNVHKYKGVPPFAETMAYVKDVFGDVPVAA